MKADRQGAKRSSMYREPPRGALASWSTLQAMLHTLHSANPNPAAYSDFVTTVTSLLFLLVSAQTCHIE